MAYGFNDDKTKAGVYTKSEVIALLSEIKKIEDYSVTVTNVGAGQRLAGSYDITVYPGYTPIGILQIDNISNGANVEQIRTYQNEYITRLQYSVYNFSAITMNVTFTARVLYVKNSIL